MPRRRPPPPPRSLWEGVDLLEAWRAVSPAEAAGLRSLLRSPRPTLIPGGHPMMKPILALRLLMTETRGSA
ncbi:hypothetical protein [Rubellimicrobium sp. CFH 75288]|uniref:hypothetical protein n=1 Tax=Rubellimicrobium sp. CFH 75288 TaxID=2697034 RepID=UPI001412C080|nr:hypothetical protein [Rubellimicrobium sp. CFH 75288]NAZ37178.1 hypothetical protein [Rubellimicrobium sp. CFH 75288]